MSIMLHNFSIFSPNSLRDAQEEEKIIVTIYKEWVGEFPVVYKLQAAKNPCFWCKKPILPTLLLRCFNIRRL